MITTKEELISALNREIEEQARRLEHGWYRDDYIPFEILYGVPGEIVRSTVEENPKYLGHWPLLEDYIKNDGND